MGPIIDYVQYRNHRRKPWNWFSDGGGIGPGGAQIAATMRNLARSPELGEQAAKEKLPLRIETMDVDSDESVKQAFGRILAQRPVDVLVNNAGIERTGSIEE